MCVCVCVHAHMQKSKYACYTCVEGHTHVGGTQLRVYTDVHIRMMLFQWTTHVKQMS